MYLPYLRAALFAVSLSCYGWTATFGLQPYLQDVGSNHAVVLWTTLDSAGSGEVRYSEDSSFSQK